MIGISEIGQIAPLPLPGREAPEPGGGDIDAVIAVIARDAERLRAQPQLPERDQPDAAPDLPEAVDVGLPRPQPVGEFDAELEAGVGAPQEIGLVDPQPDQQIVNLRDRRLADADGADRIRFDQGDRRGIAEKACEGGGRHPTRCPAAGDHDVEGSRVAHVRPSQHRALPTSSRARHGYQNLYVNPAT